MDVTQWILIIGFFTVVGSQFAMFLHLNTRIDNVAKEVANLRVEVADLRATISDAMLNHLRLEHHKETES